jgi:probable HAF family extracellular repeat protein
MKTATKAFSLGLAVIVCIPLGTASSIAQTAQYSLTGLGTLGGDSYAYGINNNRQVVGNYVYQPEPDWSELHPFLYSGGTMSDLGTFGGYTSYAYDINDNGQVVGYSEVFDGTYSTDHAFLYSGGTMLDLGALISPLNYAYGINNKGQVVGSYYEDYYLPSHAYVFSGGSVQNIGPDWAAACGINNSGQIAGTMGIYECQPFLYSDGLTLGLGTLGGGISPGRIT